MDTKISDIFKKDPLKWKNAECIYKFKLQYILEDNILEHLDVLTFDAKLLHISANVIYKSLTTRQIPEDWKLARITPIYKGKGCHITMGNYRPISVTSHFAKIMEQEVQKQFLEYMLKT